MAKLIFTGEHFAGRTYELTLEKTTVGRGDQNTLVIHDPSVSQAHCEILIHGPEVIVIDLGSANGTFVNRVRLDHRQAQLKSGQIVRFGVVEARLELEASDDEATASGLTAVHDLSRILRDQRREENRLKMDPSLTLDEGVESGASDRTVVLPRIAPASDPVAPTVQAPAASPGRKPRAWIATVIGFAVVLGVVFWIWRTWFAH